MGFIFNAIKHLLKTVIKLSLYLAIFATIILLIPNLPPYAKFTSIEISPTQPRVGPLATNGALNNVGRSFDGKLLGPEAFQEYKGELYTSLATGEIVKLSPEGHVTFVTTVGQPCRGLTQEHICGRPLGIYIDDKDGTLYVADAYHGIWKVDLKTNKKQLLVSPNVEIEKRRPKLFNSMALAKNGDLYWTDSSSDFHLKDGVISFMCDPSGRLFHYDAAKNKSKVLLDDLWFANGVALSPDNEFVVVSESSQSRILKYYVNGPKKGLSEVFVAGLPGVPDNLRALPDGSGVLVALYTVFEEDRPPLTQLLATTPLIRKLAARLHRLVEIPFEYLNSVYPHIMFEEIVYYIGHFKSISSLTPAMSGLLQVDWDGNIVAAYYNTDKTLVHVSDAIVFNDKLYIGSPHLQDFVGTVPAPPLLKKAFVLSKKSEAPQVEKEKKPVQQAPKKTEEKPKAKVEAIPKMEIKPKVVEQTKPATKPEAPKVAKPEAPKVPKAEAPKAAKPEAPKVAKPEAPKVAKPEAPKVAKPEAPKVAKPEAPKVAKPEAPKVAKPEAPKVAKPEAPKVAKPEAPKVAKPEAPKEAKPEAPKVVKQDASEPKQPQPPKTPPPPKPIPSAVKPEPANLPIKTDPKLTKPEVKTTPPPQPSERTISPSPKPTPKEKEAKNEVPKKAQSQVKQDSHKNVESKPIKEEIPSDTAKPTKETLKVIRKDGPAEIHVPNQ